MSALHVAVAPNAFKGTLTAQQATEAICRGVEAALPGAVLMSVPIADGGDGSVDAFIAAGWEETRVHVRDALGRMHEASIATRGDRAVVEVANTCGLALLGQERKPLHASTLGLGDAMRAAATGGARHITVCLGGSASTDGGAGMLVALGARLLDADGQPVLPSGEQLERVTELDLAGMQWDPAGITVHVITDVRSPLLGLEGAAHMFGPQKGATADEVTRLEAALRRWAHLLAETTGRDVSAMPGSGAAGGTGAALAAVWDAGLHSATEILDIAGLPQALLTADVVITGEGRLDSSTLSGKGCAAVIELANASGVPALAVCGQVDLTSQDIARLGLEGAWACDGPGPSAAASLTASTEAALSEWRRIISHHR